MMGGTDYSGVERRAGELRGRGVIIVTVNGCFDLIHPGHLRLLKHARGLGDYLFLLLNSDRSVKRIKGEMRPIIREEERMEIMGSIRWVDEVVLFEEDEPLELLMRIRPRFHVKAKPLNEEKVEKERRVVEEGGGELIVIEKQGEFSTTSIIERIRDLSS